MVIKMTLKKFFTAEDKVLKTFLFTGIALRIIVFAVNLIVGGLNCDEAMISLNAYSLADRMTDINGERLPVYFDTWVIGGQSPLATYLTALSVKILGKNLFAVRLPALVFSILGFIALYFFAKEVFKDKKHVLTFVGLCTVCPWMLYSGAYILDCNFIGHILMAALLFFVKALKNNKSAYYIISMALFSLCFYCYIASVLLIPILLIALYSVLLIKKKISIKNTLISIVTVVIIAIPFILWGLVVTGLIPEFKLLGFSYSAMPGYIRENDTVFTSKGAASLIVTLLTNFVSSFLMLILNDWSAFALGSNIFGYGFVLSGIIMIMGFIKILFSLLKKDKELCFNTKLFSVAFIAGIICFCSFINEPHLGSLYRYGVLSYLLIFFETIGFVEIFRIFKRKNFIRFLSIYLTVSLAFFAGVYAFAYIPQVKTTSKSGLVQENYGDPFFECMDFAKENGYDYVVVYKNPKVTMDSSLFAAAYERYYYYGEKSFYSIEDEITNNNPHKDDKGNYSVTCDGTLAYNLINENCKINSDFCIVRADYASKLDFDKNEYKTKRYGVWLTIYREK